MNDEDDKIDTYGVDHSGFSTRDELYYQNARINRENEIMTQLRNQGIAKNPHYTTEFWGTSKDNNYGFGTSNIEKNIENIKYHDTSLKSSISNSESPLSRDNNALKMNDVGILEQTKDFLQNTSTELKNNISDAYNTYKNDGLYALGKQYAEPSVKRAMKAADWLTELPISDVNKHQYVSCVGSTGGPLATTETLAGGVYKEILDTKNKLSDPQKKQAYGGVLGVLADAQKDLANDFKGAWRGFKTRNPLDCEEFLPTYLRYYKYW
mgnify:CR=1 FL=1